MSFTDFSQVFYPKIRKVRDIEFELDHEVSETFLRYLVQKWGIIRDIEFEWEVSETFLRYLVQKWGIIRDIEFELGVSQK